MTKLGESIEFEPEAHTRPFWEAARANRFEMPYCDSCSRFHFYPRPLCPHCGGFALVWRGAAREARIVALTTVYRAPSPVFEADVPYTLGIAQTLVGPCLFGRIIGGGETFVGMAVRIDFEHSPGEDRVVFRPHAPPE
jgi:uncharacterized OB-fold protein